jgi:hypothetical protein
MHAHSPAKVVVTFERRSDGGLRAYSDAVPGFVLSHIDPLAVLDDVRPALEGILSHMFDARILVEELSRLHDQLAGLLNEQRQPIPAQREYVTLAAILPASFL